MYRSFVFPTLLLLFVSVNAFAQTAQSRTVISSKSKSETVTAKNSKTLAAAKRRGGSARAATPGTRGKVVTTNRYNQNTSANTNKHAQKNCDKATPISAGANHGYEVGRPSDHNGTVSSQGQIVTKPASVTMPAKARSGAARQTTTASTAGRVGVTSSAAKQPTSAVAKKRTGAVVVD